MDDVADIDVAERPQEAADPNRKVSGETPAQSQEASRKRPEGLRAWAGRHALIALALVAVVMLAAAGALLWWLDARHYETTDDAFIDGRPVNISTEVAGAIVDVPVSDNQVVEQGAVLARIDDRDYRASVESTGAQVAQAEAAIVNVDAQIGVQQAAIDQASQQADEAQAALTFAREENQRYQDLMKTGSGTVQRAQQAQTDLQQRQAALNAATAGKLQAQKQLAVLQAQRKTAEAQLLAATAQQDQAQANLSRTELKASARGRVTRLTGAKGAYASPGQTLMILVPDTLWVTANYMETQLADMQPGQPVTISIDAYGRDFPGHVDSIQAGSGTAFSLLPAQNATGNFVKVVQRVPVKLTFDKPPDVEIGPGMSVVPSVKVR
jgi:membrane fusion protein (multidrug efflux system)